MNEIPKNDSNVVVLNFIDGMEEGDGWPGLSVLKCMEECGLAFTGGDSVFFGLDSSKNVMKEHLVKCDAPTPRFCDLSYPPERNTALAEISKLCFPVIVKPSTSSSSRGITDKSIVYNAQDAYDAAIQINHEFAGCYLEEFITGREFTALVSGSSIVSGVQTYSVLERVFRKDVPEDQRFLSYHRKFSDYSENEQDTRGSWWSAPAPEEEQPRLQAIARDIFEKIHGNGYARMDLRECHITKKVYVVDVNCNCACDYDPNSAMGIILRSSGVPYEEFIQRILEDGIKRRHAIAAEFTATSTAEFAGTLKTKYPSKEYLAVAAE